MGGKKYKTVIFGKERKFFKNNGEPFQNVIMFSRKLSFSRFIGKFKVFNKKRKLFKIKEAGLNNFKRNVEAFPYVKRESKKWKLNKY